MTVVCGSFAVSIEASRRQALSQGQMYPNPLQETGQAAAIAILKCHLSRIRAELYQKKKNLSSEFTPKVQDQGFTMKTRR